MTIHLFPLDEDLRRERIREHNSRFVRELHNHCRDPFGYQEFEKPTMRLTWGQLAFGVGAVVFWGALFGLVTLLWRMA